MKRILMLLLALLLTLTAAGCIRRETEPAGRTLALYGAADAEKAQGGDILAAVNVDWTAQADRSAQEQAREAMELLLGGAEGYASPVPAPTQLLSCTVSGSAAWVDLSGAYSQLTGVEQTIADYCITLTLTQIAPIHMVRITANGREASYRSSAYFLASEALLTSTEDIVRTFAARLYYLGADGALTGEDRVLTLYEGESRGAVILAALKGSPETEGARPAVPEGFEVLSFRTEGGVCYVNLPSADEALLPPTAEEQEALAQSIVRSLCSISGIGSVQFLVDGEMRSTFGALDVSQPMGPA